MRDTKNLPIDFYQYNDTFEVTSPLQKNTSYQKTSNQTDFYSVCGYPQLYQELQSAHNTTFMAGVQYNMK